MLSCRASFEVPFSIINYIFYQLVFVWNQLQHIINIPETLLPKKGKVKRIIPWATIAFESFRVKHAVLCEMPWNTSRFMRYTCVMNRCIVEHIFIFSFRISLILLLVKVTVKNFVYWSSDIIIQACKEKRTSSKA